LNLNESNSKAKSKSEELPEQVDIRAIFVDDNVNEIMELGNHPNILRVLFVRGVD